MNIMQLCPCHGFWTKLDQFEDIPRMQLRVHADCWMDLAPYCPAKMLNHTRQQTTPLIPGSGNALKHLKTQIFGKTTPNWGNAHAKLANRGSRWTRSKIRAISCAQRMWVPSSGTYLESLEPLELVKTVLQTVASQYHLPSVASGRCWCKTHWGSPPNNSPSNTNCKKHLPSQHKWPTKGRTACMTPSSWHCIEWSKLIARIASLRAWTLHVFLIQYIYFSTLRCSGTLLPSVYDGPPCQFATWKLCPYCILNSLER